MNYLLKSKPKYKHWGKVVLAVVLFCFFSLFVYLFPNFSRSLSLTVSKPLWLVCDVITRPFSSIGGYFVSKKSLIEDNLSLKQEIVGLRMTEVDHQVLLKEFEDMKSKLGRGENASRIVSRVLSKPPYSPYDTFVIDAGSEDGVSLGSPVYISDNIIVGLIKNVTPSTSLVELFSNGGLEQETTLSRTGAMYKLQGLGGANMKLEVPKDTDIVWGDVFLYPRFSPSMVGSVYYIDVSSQSSFKTIYIRVPVNVFATKYVFVESK